MAVLEHIQEEGFQEVARRYFPDRVRDVTDEYGSYSVVDLESAEDQRLAAEEYIAHIAQRGVPKPSWWKEFLNKIRMWWNGTGWGKKYPVTTDQIEVLLARSSRKMRKHWYNRRSEVLIGGENGSFSAPIGAMEDGQRTDLRFDLFDNQEKSRKIFSALQKIADGSESETIKGLRDDLSEYGGTNDITFYWGNEKKGIYHIAYRRGVNTLLHVIDAVADGRVLRYVEGNKTVVLEKDGFEAVLALTEYGEKKSWLLSGWETGKPDAISEVGTQSDATQSMPTFSRQELGAGLRNIIPQNSENASDETEKNGELRSVTDGNRSSVAPDGAVEDKGDIRYSLEDYSEADHRDIVAILQPFVGQVVDLKESEYRKYLLEHGVDIPEDDAKAFAVEAMRANQKIARQRGIRKRDNWLYENYPLFRMVAEVAGDNFMINPEYTSSEGEHFTGSWIAPEFVKYSGPPKKFEEFSSAKLYQAYLARREKALKHAKGMDLSDIAEAISRKTGRDSLTLKEEIKDFFRDLKKKEFYGRYSEWKKNQAFEDRALRDAAMAEWQQQEKYRIEDEVISILQNGLEIQHKTKGEKNIFFSLLLNFI